MRTLRKVGRRLLGLVCPSGGHVSSSGPVTTVSETTACTPRRSSGGEARLNILLPSLNKRHYFGGIHTAAMLYRALAAHFPQARIILLDSAPDPEALARFGDHVLVDSRVDDHASLQIVDFSDRYGRTLPVREHDCWMATAWWTAYAGQRLSAWQGTEYGSPGRLTYLIQDFEPAFYPWSSQSALALGTYRPDVDVAVFNTNLLAEYFKQQSLAFARQCVFEPCINDGLRDALAAARLSRDSRKKRLVVYARPSTPRNGFELLCESLRAWGWSDPACREWEVVAVGELTSDIDLGPLTIKALGKMDIDAYADLLRTSAIGVSLMFSPHPSYPPLEMAAFGMGVVTNRFANKDLSHFSKNVRSAERFTPESIAELIAREVVAWETREMKPATVMDAEHPFLLESHFDALANRVTALLDSMVGR